MFELITIPASAIDNVNAQVAINDVNDVNDINNVNDINDAPVISAEMSDVLNERNAQSAVVLKKLLNLEKDCKSWELNELTASRKRLYALLTECYAIYMTMKTSQEKAVRAQIKIALDAFIKARGYSCLSNSHDMIKVVKCVFGIDRRRVSAYSQALRVALVSGGIDAAGKQRAVPTANLSTWLEENGGVEEIRMGSKNKGMTVKDRAQAVEGVLQSTRLATFKPDGNVIALDMNSVDKTVLLVATYRPSGEFEINAVVTNNSAVQSALAAHYSSHKDEVERKAADVAVAVITDAKQSAIEAAALEV